MIHDPPLLIIISRLSSILKFDLINPSTFLRSERSIGARTGWSKSLELASLFTPLIPVGGERERGREELLLARFAVLLQFSSLFPLGDVPALLGVMCEWCFPRYVFVYSFFHIFFSLRCRSIMRPNVRLCGGKIDMNSELFQFFFFQCIK